MPFFELKVKHLVIFFAAMDLLSYKILPVSRPLRKENQQNFNVKYQKEPKA